MDLNDKKAGAFKWLIPANETTRGNCLALADECALLSAIIVFFFFINSSNRTTATKLLVSQIRFSFLQKDARNERVALDLAVLVTFSQGS